MNGEAAHALFRYLKKAAPGIFGTQWVKWNFTSVASPSPARCRAT